MNYILLHHFIAFHILFYSGKRLKNPKVREYLLGETEKFYKISAPALEMIVFCIQETVAEVCAEKNRHLAKSYFL